MDINKKPGEILFGQPRVAVDDFYWLAVPLDGIVEIAKGRLTECSEVSDLMLHRCAEDSVKSILCHCASDLDSVVETAALLFCDEIRKQ